MYRSIRTTKLHFIWQRFICFAWTQFIRLLMDFCWNESKVDHFGFPMAEVAIISVHSNNLKPITHLKLMTAIFFCIIIIFNAWRRCWFPSRSNKRVRGLTKKGNSSFGRIFSRRNRHNHRSREKRNRQLKISKNWKTFFWFLKWINDCLPA